MIQFSREYLRDRIYACWIGKNIGGTLMEKNGEALEATRRAEIFLQALKDKGWIE